MTIQIPDFSKARVLVVGDIMLDRYFSGDTARISPEAPIPVVKIIHKDNRPGGAGNVALNIISLCAAVKLFGIVGDDSSAEKLEAALNQNGVAHHLLKDPNASTITKVRVLSQHQQLIRLDFEDKFHSDYVEELFEIYKKELPHYNAVVLSDYLKGTLIHARKFIDAARELNIPVFVDPKSTDFKDYSGATIVKPNTKEFEAAVGKCHSEDDFVAKAHQLIEDSGIDTLLITRGAKGMMLVTKDEKEVVFPTHAREVFDVTGAGDTAIAVLAASVAAGLELTEAVKLSNIASGVVVGKLGAATVTVPELSQQLQNGYERKFKQEDELLKVIAEAHAKGEKIVMTNGCFDLLHAGHVQYLEKAKRLGNRLIIAVNDDDSVARLKGPQRPINSLLKRMSVLAGLSSVDWVVPFSEDTPERLICKLLPDVLIKGSDYQINEIAGATCVLNNGGQVKTVDLLPGCSTTSMVDRIRAENDMEKR